MNDTKHKLLFRENSTASNHVKEVIGLLFIEKIPETIIVKSEYVKCPVCRGGRLFDKPAGDKAVVIVVHSTTNEQLSQRMIIKCPKCSQKFLISID